MASSELSAFVLELVLWLRCDGKEKAEDWQGLWAVEAGLVKVLPILSTSAVMENTLGMFAGTYCILDRTHCIFS